MIPSNWKHEPDILDEHGWPRNTCLRCGSVRYAPDHPSKWKGDPQWCPAWPFPHELGHWFTILLAAIFIRQKDYLWLKRKLGFAPKCGCNQREQALNSLGQRLWSWFAP